jgi:hypothetical protein
MVLDVSRSAAIAEALALPFGMIYTTVDKCTLPAEFLT